MIPRAVLEAIAAILIAVRPTSADAIGVALVRQQRMKSAICAVYIGRLQCTYPAGRIWVAHIICYGYAGSLFDRNTPSP